MFTCCARVADNTTELCFNSHDMIETIVEDLLSEWESNADGIKNRANFHC